MPLNALGIGKSFAQLQSDYVARCLGVFLHFNQDTFLDTDGSDGTELVNEFNPSSLNIDQWMTSIAAAKARYAVLTAKHISGFCLWPSAQTTYDIAATDWYTNNSNTDIVDLFVTKCRQYNIDPVLYFCVKDRNFEENNPGFTQAQYKSFTQGQITELLTNYGRVAGLWMDAANTVFFPSHGYPWDSSAEANGFVRNLQTGCLCINNAQNNLPPSMAETNIAIYEGANFPGQFVDVGNTDPAECAQTIYDNGSPSSWFWKSTVPTLRATNTCLTELSTANARNSAYLLNFPPDNTGNIESRMTSVMATIGAR